MARTGRYLPSTPRAKSSSLLGFLLKGSAGDKWETMNKRNTWDEKHRKTESSTVLTALFSTMLESTNYCGGRRGKIPSTFYWGHAADKASAVMFHIISKQ